MPPEEVTFGGLRFALDLDRRSVVFAVGVALLTSLVLIVLYFFSRRALLTRSSSSFAFDMHKGHKREEDAMAIGPKSIAVLDFRPFKVISTMQVSHNVKLIRFELPENKSLDLPVGRHLSIRATVDKNKVIRAYTPTTHPTQKGHFELLVKVYEHGKLSRHLHQLKVGDFIEARGPIGRFQYAPNKYKHMCFLVGGSGVTPAMQVLRSILEDKTDVFKDDKTVFTVFYQNRTIEDILLRSDLEAMQALHASRLRVAFFLSNPNSNKEVHWPNSSSLSISSSHTEVAREAGYIDEKAMANVNLASGCDFVGICGPSAFNQAMKRLAEASGGHTDDTIYMW